MCFERRQDLHEARPDVLIGRSGTTLDPPEFIYSQTIEMHKTPKGRKRVIG
jgi:hypothetical protein